MHSSKPHPTPTESEYPGVEPRNLLAAQVPEGILRHTKQFEYHCYRIFPYSSPHSLEPQRRKSDCVSQLFVTVTKYLGETAEERFILAHGLKGFSPCSVDSIALDVRQGGISWWKGRVEESCSLQSSQEAEGGGLMIRYSH